MIIIIIIIIRHFISFCLFHFHFFFLLNITDSFFLFKKKRHGPVPKTIPLPMPGREGSSLAERERGDPGGPLLGEGRDFSPFYYPIVDD